MRAARENHGPASWLADGTLAARTQRAEPRASKIRTPLFTKGDPLEKFQWDERAPHVVDGAHAQQETAGAHRHLTHGTLVLSCSQCKETHLPRKIPGHIILFFFFYQALVLDRGRSNTGRGKLSRGMRLKEGSGGVFFSFFFLFKQRISLRAAEGATQRCDR